MNRVRHYLQGFLHPGSFIQSALLQLGHLTLQAHHLPLPPLEGALRESLGQILQDPGMMAQELEEPLKTRWNWLHFTNQDPGRPLNVPQTDRMAAVLLLELSPIAELSVRLLGEAFRAHSQQLLQAADQPLVLALQLHAALHLVRLGANATQSTVQLTLNVTEERRFQDSTCLS